jgi:ferritin-like metal-binding protein YciE
MTNNTLLANVPADLMYQALETEKGGVQIYTTALRLALNKDLREEWNKYLEQTKNHVQVLTEILKALGLDPDTETPGRKVVRYLGTSLVKTMELAARCADPQAAQIVAAECVVHAETKDHLNWELLGEFAKQANADESALLMPAYQQVEAEEDEHLYHTAGWTRELWMESLRMPAVLPPPEEVRNVENAIEAAQAKKSRTAVGKTNTAANAKKASAR